MFLPPSKGIKFGPNDPTWDETCQWLIAGNDQEFAVHLLTCPDLSKSYGWGETSICEVAIACDAVGKLGQLFAAGADPFQLKSNNLYGGSSQLHAAAYHGSVSCLKYLLSNAHHRMQQSLLCMPATVEKVSAVGTKTLPPVLAKERSFPGFGVGGSP